MQMKTPFPPLLKRFLAILSLPTANQLQGPQVSRAKVMPLKIAFDKLRFCKIQRRMLDVVDR